MGGDAAVYPADNFFPKSVGQVGFIDPERRDYRLAKASRSIGAATDGKGAGVDFSAGRGDRP